MDPSHLSDRPLVRRVPRLAPDQRCRQIKNCLHRGGGASVRESSAYLHSVAKITTFWLFRRARA
jgi:hypothetical protein